MKKSVRIIKMVLLLTLLSSSAACAAPRPVMGGRRIAPCSVARRPAVVVKSPAVVVRRPVVVARPVVISPFFGFWGIFRIRI